VLSRAEQTVFPSLNNLSFSFELRRLMSRWIRENGIALLHVHTGPGGILLSRRPDVPLIVTANHTYFQQSRLRGQGWKRFLVPAERRTYAFADSIICISDDTAQVLQSTYGVSREKIKIIPCGFPLASWGAQDTGLSGRSLNVVFVGRPDRRKGWDLLRLAWSRVRAALPHAQLHIVGFTDVPLSGVVFHGRLPEKELQTLVGKSRCLLCPSAFEGFGLAAAEAIAAGTPVVATDVAGLRQSVGKQAGLLVSPDTGVFADAIIRCLSDDVLWHRLHAGCLEKRADFDPDREVLAHTEVYRALYSAQQ
jgi:glycosyltransferase involved in cell wall biosynthesis